jgi:hypothetical protein
MASNSILKLQVDDKQYEASLKSAQQGLQALMNALRNSGKSFSDLDKNTAQYVRALGNMEATAKTTRGRIGEMSSAFVELSQVEKQLTDQERQSPIGKALTESLNQLKQRTIEAKKELADLDKQLTSQKAPATTGGIFSGLGSKMEGALAVFGGNLMTKAAGAVAQLGSEMADMVKQGVEMAKAGEGVRIAFERLGRGDILNGLREATHGTVTDLELMKAAVKFNDFKLPLDELGTMLAFAQQKAKDTGQSVDYMTESIVTGLGRKSLMILDNLGLSATEIRERMKETGDMTKAVGAIIRDQMKNAGDYVETAADRAAQANVSLQNKMEELGRKFAPVEEASNQLWTSMKIGILDIIGGPLATLLNSLTEAGRLKNALNGLNGEDGSGNTKVGQQLKKLQAIKKAGGSDYIFNSTLSGMKEDYNREIAWREQYAKDIQAWQSGKRSDVLSARIKEGQKRSGNDFLDAERVTTEANAYKVMLSQLMSGAKDITNPRTTPTTPVKLPTTPTKTTKEDIQFADDSIMAQEKLVQELTQKWKTASGELRDGYLKDLEDAQQKLAEMTGKAKGPDLDKLFPDMSKENYNTGYAGSAQAKYDSARADLALGPMNFDAINDYIGSVKGMLKDADLGSELYNNMTEKLKDATTVSTLLQEMMERGLEGADLETTAQALKEKLLSPEGIDQTAVQSFLDTLNKQIEEAGGVGLKLNSKTGEVSDKDKGKDERDGNRFLKKNDEGKYEAKMTDIMSGMAGGINNVVSGLNTLGVEIPAGLQSVLGGMQAITSILSGIAVTAMAIEAIAGADAIIPFANGGVVPAFAQGGLIGRAAGGLMIPGNFMSGDRLRLPVDGGRGMIGVNSGELILNRAQQGIIASELEGGGMQNLHLDTVIGAEDIRVVLNNRGRRTGRGEYVQSRKYNG